MMNTLTNRTLIVSLLSLLALCSPIHAAEKSRDVARAIDAEVIDAGDYYLGLDGKPIRFKRKKDVFLKLDSIKRARQQTSHGNKAAGQATSNSAPNTLTPGFSRVSNHRWGALDIIKADHTQSGYSTNNQIPQHTTNSAGMAPVFAAENGRGEYLILPDIMISFDSKRAVLQHQQAMLSQFGMHVKNQMMFSDTNFVLAFNEPITNYGQVFSTTRDLMALPYINWAEPNMQVKLKKTEVPNDVLFREQWGLYNWGLNGEFCDADTNIAADIDANDAWDLMDTLSLGSKPVIAIIDDGVGTLGEILPTHSDLPIWTNPSPASGIPYSSNRCENDTYGCNFGDFYESGGRVYNNSDASTVVHPVPQTVNDTHGTQVAGIAAAKRDNSIGISGSAYDAEILPIRLDFYTGAMDCVALVDALSYAAKYADIISNSWRINTGDQASQIDDPSDDPDLGIVSCSSAMDRILTKIGTGDNTYKRGTSGTPVLFASGNSAAGWRKITLDGLTPGSHTIKLVFHKDDAFLTDVAEDAIWIDDLTLPGNSFPGQTSFDFDTGMPSGMEILAGANSTVPPTGTVVDYNECTGTATGESTVNGTGEHVFGGSGNAVRLKTTEGNCEYLSVTTTLTESGDLSFWVWVSAEPWVLTTGPTELLGDPFRVYIDGVKTTVDLINAGQDGVDPSRNSLIEQFIYHEQLDYPASHSDVIAVGASNDGSDAQMEDRAYFSQYGPTLDVVAPGTAIRSTTSSGGYGYLSGTSASTPMVAGIIANMLAVDPNLTLTQINNYLHDGADEIGPNVGEFTYSSDFNKYYGHGRANSYKSVQLANGTTVGSLIEAPETCEDPNPGAAEDDFWLLMMPAILAGANKN